MESAEDIIDKGLLSKIDEEFLKLHNEERDLKMDQRLEQAYHPRRHIDGK